MIYEDCPYDIQVGAKYVVPSLLFLGNMFRKDHSVANNKFQIHVNNHCNMEAILNFIGKVHSTLINIDDCPLQENEHSPIATLEIYPQYLEGIKDIKEGSEILLLTWLHVADRSVTQCRTRNNKDGESAGVFSTRSPDRPNPIGIHFVKVESVEEERFIRISGLEVLDQTPLVDIKPMWNISVRTT